MTASIGAHLPAVTSRWRNLPAHGVVGVALSELADSSREVEAVVAHLPSVDDVEHMLVGAAAFFPTASDSAIECSVTSALGRAFVMLARRRPKRIGDDQPTSVVTIADFGPRLGLVPHTAPLGRIIANPQGRSVYGGLDHDEFLLELEPGTEQNWPPGAFDVGPAVAIAAGLAGEKRRPLWFVNGPSAPPGPGLRAPAGPFLRFGVSGLDNVDERFAFGESLVRRCADPEVGIGVWVPDDYGDGRIADYWHQLFGATSAAASPLSPTARQRAITLVGPARPGMTALMVNWIRRKAPTRPIHGLFMSSFADLAVVNVLTVASPAVAGADVVAFDPRPAQQVLVSLYGAPPDRGIELDDDRLAVNDFPPPTHDPSDDAGRSTLWLTWRIPHPSPVPLLLPAARWALETTLGAVDLGLRIDYLVSREESDRLVVGRAKVSVATPSLSGRDGSLSKTVDAIERRWRDRVAAIVDLPRLSLRVAWRDELALRTTSGLHGAGATPPLTHVPIVRRRSEVGGKHVLGE